MKRKEIFLVIITLIVLLFPVSVILWLLKDNSVSDQKLASALFGISLKDYTVIDKKNTLSEEERDGTYILYLELEASQLEDFYEKIKKEQYEEFSDEKLLYESIKEGSETNQEDEANENNEVQEDNDGYQLKAAQIRSANEEMAANVFGIDRDRIEKLFVYTGHSKRDWIKSDVTRWSPSEGYVVVEKTEGERVCVDLYYLD